MTRIAPVDLQFNPKTLWFDAGELEIEVGSAVVVTTARGLEYGHLAAEVFEASDDQVSKLKTPLKPVERVASAEDSQKAEEMAQLSKDAMPTFREMAEEFAPDMNPVSVEYLLDGDKAIFYFESEERVDFRELVRKLAAHFHVRVDMRQIGVRDEARMVGGIGHCGQELCCKRLGGEFCPVSIRMAKEQDLSLNPQKISGVCGRLMCCLRYEFDAYKEFKGRAPKVGALIHTPAGDGKVTDLDVPREIVTVKVGDEKPVKVPLSSFEPAEEGQARPNTIGQRAWEEANSTDIADSIGSALVTFSTSELTGKVKLAEPTAKVRTTKRSDKQPKQTSASKGSKGRANTAKSAPAKDSTSRKPRRRRSTKIDNSGVISEAAANNSLQSSVATGQASSGIKGSGKANAGKAKSQRNKQRSGAKKSKNSLPAQGKQEASHVGQSSGSTSNTPVRPGQNSSGLHRRSRRRSHQGTKTDSSNNSTN